MAKKSERFTWIIATHNSEEYEMSLKKFEGTVTEIKRHLSNLIKIDKSRDPDSFVEGTTKVSELTVWYDKMVDGTVADIDGYISFYDYRIDYIASRLDLLRESKAN